MIVVQDTLTAPTQEIINGMGLASHVHLFAKSVPLRINRVLIFLDLLTE